MNTIWRPLDDLPGYEMREDGAVRHVRILKPGRDGTLTFSICGVRLTRSVRALWRATWPLKAREADLEAARAEEGRRSAASGGLPVTSPLKVEPRPGKFSEMRGGRADAEPLSPAARPTLEGLTPEEPAIMDRVRAENALYPRPGPRR